MIPRRSSKNKTTLKFSSNVNIAKLRDFFLPLRTYACLCQPKSRDWRTHTAQREAKVWLTQDTYLFAAKAKQRTSMRHLIRTTSKRHRSKLSWMCKQELIRIHSLQMEQRSYAHSVSHEHRLDRSASGTDGCMRFRKSYLPCFKGGKWKTPPHLGTREEHRCLHYSFKKSYVRVLWSAIQERKKVSAADPAAPVDPIGRSSDSGSSSRVLAFIRKIKDVWPGQGIFLATWCVAFLMESKPPINECTTFHALWHSAKVRAVRAERTEERRREEKRREEKRREEKRREEKRREEKRREEKRREVLWKRREEKSREEKRREEKRREEKRREEKRREEKRREEKRREEKRREEKRREEKRREEKEEKRKRREEKRREEKSCEREERKKEQRAEKEIVMRRDRDAER